MNEYTLNTVIQKKKKNCKLAIEFTNKFKKHNTNDNKRLKIETINN